MACMMCESFGNTTPGERDYVTVEPVTRFGGCLFQNPTHVYICKDCYNELSDEEKENWEKSE